jgi:hypothetical protein
MAKAVKKQVEAAGAASTITGTKADLVILDDVPNCLNCMYSGPLDVNRFMRCDIPLPPFLRRSDRPQDYLVRADSVCALHQRLDFL